MANTKAGRGAGNGEAEQEDMDGLTPTQRAIWTALADGNRHARGELLAMLNDDATGVKRLDVHMTYLRHKVRPRGFDIMTMRAFGETCYQLARRVRSK